MIKPKDPSHPDHAEYLAKKRDYYRRTIDRQHELQARAYTKNRENIRRDQKKYYRENQRKCHAATMLWRKNNPERLKELVKASYDRNRERILARQREYRAILRDQMLENYGRSCACCGEACPVFLTLDHVHNDGYKERALQPNGRRRTCGGTALYQRLRKQGWPKGQYQVLCYNCNCAKGFFGRCPHQDAVERTA